MLGIEMEENGKDPQKGWTREQGQLLHTTITSAGIFLLLAIYLPDDLAGRWPEATPYTLHALSLAYVVLISWVVELYERQDLGLQQAPPAAAQKDQRGSAEVNRDLRRQTNVTRLRSRR